MESAEANRPGTQEAVNQPLRVSLSFAENDRRFAELLHQQVEGQEQEGLITVTRRAESPEPRNPESFDIFLFLISPDSVASEYVRREIDEAVALAEMGRAKIMPVLMRPCEWSNTPLIRYRAWPGNAVPAAEWQDFNAALADIARGVLSLVESVFEERKARQQIAGQELFTVDNAHRGSIHSIAYAADAGIWVSAGSDGNLRVWNSWLEKVSLLGADRPVSAVGISPDGRSIAGFFPGEGCRFWEISGRELKAPQGTTTIPLIAASNTHVLTAAPGEIRTWNPHHLDKGQSVLNTALWGDVTAAVFARRGVLLGTRSGEILEWSEGSVRHLYRAEGEVRRLASSGDPGRVGIIINGPGILDLSDSATPVTWISLDHPGAFEIALSGDGRLALTVSPESARLWDLRTHIAIRTFSAPAVTITAAALSADGKIALLGCGDGRLIRWNFEAPIATAQTSFTLPAGNDRIHLAYLSVLENPRYF